MAFVVCAILPLVLLMIGHRYPCWAIADHHWLAAAGTIGDSFGLANAAFSGAAMITALFAIMSQSKELELQRKYSIEASDDAKADAVFEMYKEFSLKEKQRLGGWITLKKFMRSPLYRKYVVKTSNLAEFHEHRFSEELWADFRDDLNAPEVYATFESARAKENSDRHDLLDILNFFSVLALRKARPETFRRCNFFYDWWGPPMWYYALKVEQYRLTINEIDRTRLLEREWISMLVRLDEIYGACTESELAVRQQLLRDSGDIEKRKDLVTKVLEQIENISFVHDHVSRKVDAHDPLAIKLLEHIYKKEEYLVPYDLPEQEKLFKRLRLLEHIQYAERIDWKALTPGCNIVNPQVMKLTDEGKQFVKKYGNVTEKDSPAKPSPDDSPPAIGG